MALALKSVGDERILYFDGFFAKQLAHPRRISARPMRLAFGVNNSIYMLGRTDVYRYENDSWQELYSHSVKIHGSGELVTAVDGLMLSKNEIRQVDKQFLDRANLIVREFLGDEHFSVEQFAKEMGMSRSNFYKKFRDLTGVSPAAFVKVKRLNEAARSILNGLGNITEIAFDVGFSDVSYFSRSFKDYFGCPPSKYTGVEAGGSKMEAEDS